MATKRTITRLYWVDGADTGVIERQRQVHIGIMLDVVSKAGVIGVGRNRLNHTVQDFLEVFDDIDRERWGRCSLDQHYGWLVKKYGEYVRAEYEDECVHETPAVTPEAVVVGREAPENELVAAELVAC